MKYYNTLPLFSTFVLFLVSLAKCQDTCNGHSSLCDRSYSDITYLVTHDSYAVGKNIAATQNVPIIDQLNQGVRGLKFSAVAPILDRAAVHLCHTSCSILDAGSASSVLDTVAKWLDEHPREVITIMWNNLYNMKASHLANVYSASKIAPYLYTHDSSKPWPTLKAMIDSGKRVVNFVDSQADEKNVPWLMDQFQLVFETPYENTDQSSFKCTIDRPSTLTSADEHMYVMNHFLYGTLKIGSIEAQVPQRDSASTTNSNSLRDQTTECTRTFGKKPNFIEVDFYDEGDAMEIVSELNEVPWVKRDGVTEGPAITPSAPTKTQIQWIPTHIFINNSGSKESVQNWVISSLSLVIIMFNIFII
ncbi:PLC-like phosphodiesterase [Phycomyces nitens]|nr:PLC-like phosphodiesterase [Phycomyces nitens]